MSSPEYDSLLARSVELVVQSQAFSRIGLQHAFRISLTEAKQMTRALEELGIIALGSPDAPREVLAGLGDLPVLLGELLMQRNDSRAWPLAS
jgi:DNA segregation ATPase FtsK/SpoIIIE-like protein